MLGKGKDLFSSGKEKRHLIIIFTKNSRYYNEHQDYWLHSHVFPSTFYIP